MLTKFSNNFGIEAFSWIYKFYYNFNYFKPNKSASLLRKT